MDNVKMNTFTEMSQNELMGIDGGVWWEAAVALWALYEVGYAVGKFYYYCKH